jgi:glyoxylase-like metal-dependent hydrolase (beta-lactamase superfamily II)
MPRKPTLFASIILTLAFSGCSPRTADTTSWCSQSLRPEFSKYVEIPTQQPWFKVYPVGNGVYAIAEPYNFQEVISYLIVGSERNILFDTGMGMGKISEVVAELSSNPVTIINSHSHYDHIGGNHEFDTVLTVDTAYTRKYSSEGWPHELIHQEVRIDAFCPHNLPDLDTSVYSVKAYADKIKGYLKDGDTLNLGNRVIEILRVPGHTPDGIALLDRANGYLWTGDVFYEATIWLFFDGTDLDAYENSIARFAELSPSLTTVFPAHNTPTADPRHLFDLKEAFASIRNGKATARTNESSMHPEDNRAVTFEFKHFSFLIRKDQLPLE